MILKLAEKLTICCNTGSKYFAFVAQLFRSRIASTLLNKFRILVKHLVLGRQESDRLLAATYDLHRKAETLGRIV